MNNIAATPFKSKYATSEHLVIFVDGKPLDIYLEEILGLDALEGLVPAMSWLLSPDDLAAVEKQVFSPEYPVFGLPILICPDDMDFHCTTVVAECAIQEETVIWSRVGFSKTSSIEDITTPINIDWFQGVPKLIFRKEDYLTCFKALKDEADETITHSVRAPR